MTDTTRQTVTVPGAEKVAQAAGEPVNGLVPGNALADYLHPGCFPARTDDLMAFLIRQHAPARLLCPLASLPRTTVFSGLEELSRALAVGSGSVTPV